MCMISSILTVTTTVCSFKEVTFLRNLKRFIHYKFDNFNDFKLFINIGFFYQKTVD